MFEGWKAVVPLSFTCALVACNPSNEASVSAPAATMSTLAESNTCNRECLLGYVDLYLAALAVKDASQAPFAADARFTENAQLLELGDGLWNTASAGPERYRLFMADGVTGQAGFYVIMRESGNPIWLAGRLRVQERTITELETVVIRSGTGFGKFDLESPDPVWNQILEPAERRTREQLIEIADKYLEALDENLADFAPFHEDCNRIENGVQTTNNAAANFGGGNGPNVGAMSCRDNINSMMWHYITDIDPRRFLAVDEQRGIVFGVFMFHHDGTHETVEIPGFGRHTYSAATRRPFTTVIPEMFKIVDGRIRQIEAVMTAIPFGSKSGWDD